MANTILTSLTALSAPAAQDVLYIVDVSDVVDNAAGSSKKITVTDFLAEAPTINTNLVTLTGSQSLTNKTLTSPTINNGTIISATLTTPKFADEGYIADANGNEILVFDSNASAINNIRITNSATGDSPGIGTEGGDTDVGFDLSTKGTGSFSFWGGTYGQVILILNPVASAVNRLTITNAITGVNPSIAPVGTDTDIGIKLTPKGAGGVQMGTSEAATIKGIYYSGNVAVNVPSITDPDIARVQVDVSGAFTMQPAVGDAVIVIPNEALPTNCRLLGAWVYQTDGIEITYGSEGGNVTGAAKNHKFMIIDLT